MSTEDRTVFRVVEKQEEPFSIWPVDLETALGGFGAGVSGTNAECLAHVDDVWTDIRPLSLRRRKVEA